MDWKTVRFDPEYPEPLDSEIIPICDALNAAGFETTQSCCGHGSDWPRIWFKHTSDARIESMARFVMSKEKGDFRLHFSLFQKEILPVGYQWMLEIHLNELYASTPPELGLDLAVEALELTTQSIIEWHEKSK